MKPRARSFVDHAFPGLDDELRAASEVGWESSLRRGLRVAAEMERVEDLHARGRAWVLFLEERAGHASSSPDEAAAGQIATAPLAAAPALGPPCHAAPPPPPPTCGGRSLPSTCLTPRLLAQRPQATRALRAG